jgi:hypothetical protein
MYTYIKTPHDTTSIVHALLWWISKNNNDIYQPPLHATFKFAFPLPVVKSSTFF